MGFYIRKAFKTGPVRLNLSKGGLGLSAGVTGARLGLNTKGIYIHGGRHGLYYRKYLKQERGSKSIGKNDRSHNPGTVYLFRDTGVTFQRSSSDVYSRSQSQTILPGGKIFSTSILAVIFLAAITFFLSFVDNLEWMIVPAIFILLIGILGIGKNIKWRRKVDKKLKNVIDRTENVKVFSPLDLDKIEKVPGKWMKYLNARIHAIIGEMAIRDEEIDTAQTFHTLDKYVPVEPNLKNQLRTEMFGNLIDEMLEDHLLSDEEEKQIRSLAGLINLSEETLAIELERLNHYSRIRREMERPLEEVNPGIPLVRGERAFEIFEHARLLEERVLNRFQKDRVQYREMGYQIDSEGKRVVTNRRMLLIERGTREYRLNRIVDITADPEAGIVEIVLNNRKSPVLITVEEPLLFAARLEKIYEEIVMSR